jgi:predicted phosphodiesterase
MRYALLADVHANIAALRAVVETLRRRRPDRWIVAGDIVGYGAFPNECVEAVVELSAVAVAGNHDLVATGRLPPTVLGEIARVSAIWTREALTGSSRQFLDELPLTRVLGDLVVTHGSLDDVSEYVTRPGRARCQLARVQREHPGARLLVMGHTHRAWAWASSTGGTRSGRASPRLPQTEPLLVNPGAVGQSRDFLPRARGAVVDIDRGRVEFVACRYDVRGYRCALRAAGLPDDGAHYVPSIPRAAARHVRRFAVGY